MPIEGPLRELGIHDVFQLLDLSRKTGVLRVSSELRHNAGSVYFDNGAVIFASIHSNPHLLGAMLVRTGKITEGDLDRARDMQTRQGDRRRLGEILVAIGALTPRDIERQVRFQIEEVVFEMMSWHEGFFSFTEETVTDVPTEAGVRIPTEALLMEGARRIDEWSRIEKRVPHLGVVPALAPPPEPGTSGGTLELLPGEWEVLTLVDGAQDVRTVAQALGRSEFEVAKTLFGLESAGVVNLRDPGPSLAGRGAAQLVELTARAEDALARHELEEARAAAERAGSAHPHDPAAHVLLGRVHLAAARPGDAVEGFRRAVRLDPLLVSAHRLLGHALAAAGRFAEAVDVWNHWERLAADSETELARRPQVHRAKTAAQTLADARGPGNGFDG